ncbi:unnamed protein product [Orchesella dallaii]
MSQPMQPWTGILDATKFGPMCIQTDMKTKMPIGAEHCLYLNVYAQQIAPAHLMPVIVYMHGDSWQRGGGDQYNPKQFMDHPVVLVTINYRLNAFGFLSTGDGEAQGNMGMKDQAMALMWVKNNIKGFGGDPERITLMGNEAGAASAHLHMMSPLTQGMFNQAISQSGSALCPWAIQTDPVSKTKMLAQWVNCDTSANKAMIECLRRKSDHEIMQAQMHFGVDGWPMSEPMLVFGPVIEQSSWPSPFITDHPKNLLMKGQVAGKPWIVGFNEDEGRYHSHPVVMDKTVCAMANSNWNKVAPISFLYDDNINQASKDTASSKIHMFYLSGKPIEPERMWNYSNIYSDRLYKSGILDAVKMQSSMNDKVFPYVMKFRGDFSYSDWMHHTDMDPNKPMPAHKDELHYLFNWMQSPEIEAQSTSHDFSWKLVSLWASFAQMGYPAATWGTTRMWKPVNPANTMIEWYALDYDTHLVMMGQDEVNRVGFWNSLPLQTTMVKSQAW